MQFPAENIRDWRGQDVIDSSGDKVGSLESVYVDTSTDEPAFGCVTIGMVGRHRLVFVPLDGATVSPSHVKVTFDKKQIKDGPAIETDGELTADQEPAVFEHYGLSHPGTPGERRLGRR